MEDTQSLLHASRRRSSSKNLSIGSRSTKWYFICLFSLKFIVQFVSALVELPLVRLFEVAVCREYGQQHSTISAAPKGDVDCKLGTIQDKVALLLGYKVTFDAIPGLIMSVWYGSLANALGRRCVLGLASIGSLLAWGWVCLVCFHGRSLRVEYAWYGSIFYFVGGGPRLFLAMLFTTCADVVPWNKRSRVFYFLHAMTHFSRMLAPPLAALMMDTHLWLPFTLAFALMTTQLLLVYFLPEPLPLILTRDRHIDNEQNDYSETDDTVTSADLTPSTLGAMRIMIGQSGLVIIFAAFVSKRMAFSSEGLTFQYASEKMHKQLSHTAWLRVSNTIGATVVLLTLLPLVSHFGPWKTPRKDILGARGSLILAILGFSIMFASRDFATLCAGMAVAGLAEGLEPSLQALGTYIVGQSLNANFFSFVSMLDLIGEILGGPVMVSAYRLRDAAGYPAGYAFLVSAALFTALLISSWFMRIKKCGVAQETCTHS